MNNELFQCFHSWIVQIIRISIECFSPASNVNLFHSVSLNKARDNFKHRMFEIVLVFTI